MRQIEIAKQLFAAMSIEREDKAARQALDQDKDQTGYWDSGIS